MVSDPFRRFVCVPCPPRGLLNPIYVICGRNIVFFPTRCSDFKKAVVTVALYCQNDKKRSRHLLLSVKRSHCSRLYGGFVLECFLPSVPFIFFFGVVATHTYYNSAKILFLRVKREMELVELKKL